MSDDFELVHLDGDEVQEVVDWAVAASALILIMGTIPRPDDREALEETLTAFYAGTTQIWNNLPDVLVYPAKALANQTIIDSEEEEEEIKRFRQELDGLDGS